MSPVIALLDIGPFELLLLAAAAVVLFGGDLPDMARKAARMIAKLRSMSSDLSQELNRPTTHLRNLRDLKRPDQLDLSPEERELLAPPDFGAPRAHDAGATSGAPPAHDASATPGDPHSPPPPERAEERADGQRPEPDARPPAESQHEPPAATTVPRSPAAADAPDTPPRSGVHDAPESDGARHPVSQPPDPARIPGSQQPDPWSDPRVDQPPVTSADPTATGPDTARPPTPASPPHEGSGAA